MGFWVFGWRRRKRMVGCGGRGERERMMMVGSNDRDFEGRLVERC